MSNPGVSLSLCVTIVMALFSCVECQNSTVDNDELGMNSLYTMVNTFLGDIVQKQQLTDSFLNLSTVFVDGKFDKDALTDWNAWADYLIGFAVCIGIGLVFVVVMPIVGIIFCCCRLCGRCGARKKLHESKRAKCKRRSYCTVLLILNTLTLAGVVCAFICNSLIYKNLKNENNDGSIGHIRSGISQMNSFLDNSVEDASTYVLDQFDETHSSILTHINDTAEEIVEDVLEELNATYYLDQAKNVNKMANNTKQKLDTVSQSLQLLQSETEELQRNLTEIKDQTEAACNNTCNGFNPADYDTDADFSSLKTLSDIADNVSKSLDMSRYIQEAEDSINTATEKARNEVKKQTEEAEKAIVNVRNKIIEGLDDLKEQKDDALQFVPDAYKDLNSADDTINDYFIYGYYALIGICSAFLLIVTLYYIGILFGLCGEKPGHGAPCCNTGAGANFLMAGVAFTFIFSWLLMLVCTVMFTISGPLYTELCRSFNDHDSQQLKVLDDVLLEGLNIENIFTNGVPPGFTISGALGKCEKNEAVFSALDLDYVVNLDDIMNIADLEVELDKLKNSMISIDNITIIGPELETKLLDLTKSGLENFDFAPYFEELGKELTKAPLTDLAHALDNISDNLSVNDSKKVILMENSARLRQLNNQTIPNLEREMITLNDTLRELQEDNTLNSTIYKLVDDLKQAQEKFNSEKQTLITEQITKLADEILTLANNSINSVTTQIRTKLYGCRPLTDAVYTMTDAVCKLVVNPVNGMWFSFGWCLFFFIPTLIFAVLLTSQYRREHEYEKEYEDTNYMMYGGNNHDTIPLTSIDHPGHSSSVGNIPPLQHHYPGHTNLAYTHDAKVSDRHHQQQRQLPPPPYEAHMQPGIAAYAPPPPQHYGHKHHDLAHQYPALHADRDRYKTSYPY